MITKFVLTGFASVATFLVPSSVVEGTLHPVPQGQEAGCTIQEVTTTYPDSTQVETTTWWGSC